MTPRQMSAMLEIQKHRRAFERLEFVSSMRLSMHAQKKELEKTMERWARSAEIQLTFED